MKAILARIIHSIFPAWIANLIIEAPAMSELPVEVQAAIASSAPIVVSAEVAPVPLVVAAPVAAPAPDLIAKLETILSALGHEFPVFWDEAVALAKKAL